MVITMGIDVTGLGAIFDLGTSIINKIFPDADARDKAKLAMLELQQQGEFKELELTYKNATEQIAVNTEEAKSQSLFVAGWRPAAGWVCVMGLLYSVFIRPMISWLATIASFSAVPPVIDNVMLMQLLFGMLGLGALRTAERLKGKA
jgi:hypothetical protein